MGQQLRSYAFPIDQIISSDSIRTRETAKPFCKELGYDINTVKWVNALYACSGKKLLEVIREIDDQYHNVIVIGHNPSITSVSNDLQKDQSIPSVRTCGIVSITFDVKAWKDIEVGKGKLNFYIYPGLY